MPGGPSEAGVLIEAFMRRPELAAGQTFSGLFVPGLNRVDYAALHPNARMETFLMSGDLSTSFREGRILFRPLAYTGCYRALAEAPFEAAVIQGAPAPGGRLSLSVSADSALAAFQNPCPRVALLNTAAPRIDDPQRTPHLDLDDFDLVVECDAPYNVTPADAPDPALEAVAQRVAALIPEGATIQVGLGRLPATIANRLGDHKALALHSGMIIDPLLPLLERGVIQGVATVGIAMGSVDLLARAAGCTNLRFAPVPETHGAAALSGRARFTAVNAALAVDLFGQVSSDMLGPRQISGPGGLPDFVRAANASPGGRAIVALPATARGGSASRIVARLEEPATSLARADAVTVVTEYGVADLRALDLDARAEALIGLAAPDFRDGLAEAWRAARGAM